MPSARSAIQPVVQMLQTVSGQQAELHAAINAQTDKTEAKPKMLETFKAPVLPAVTDYREWQESLRQSVRSGIPSKAVLLVRWWNKIDALFVEHKSIHISKRADKVVAELADSGDFEEWDIKICEGGFKTIKGHSKLERPIAEESRQASERGEIFKGRQLYARIFAHYMHDEKSYGLLSLEDLLTVKCHNNDTLRCLRDWD